MILALLICVSTIIVCSLNAGREIEREALARRQLPIWKRLAGSGDDD